MTTNILIVGVGGQGTLLASRILGAIAAELNYDCKLSEVHGMSQRGGSVVTHVRFGEEKVAAATVSVGEADYVLAFEKLEALRWCHYLAPEGKLIVNDQEILPMPVITGKEPYPTDIFGKLAELGKAVTVVDGIGLAEKAGNTKAVNTVLIGVFCRLAGISPEVAERALAASVKEKLFAVNKTALNYGYAAADKH